ncbi:hypothetical protein IP81_01600 [Novosphingobium sp. AAP83]|uniref:hypothetical protein n=1 Tax=Novosphingobium sp. AAP83 TaxID=1523425 RepID=UPI0006BA094D|nr:hypothetical protein [Novosphingobium sp. AAP83]KPF93858.1 hypothetical protein IP81_01600 [Novosphingobium sp. AAP83]
MRSLVFSIACAVLAVSLSSASAFAAAQPANGAKTKRYDAPVRMMNEDDKAALRKYCEKPANREDLRCQYFAKAVPNKGKGGGMSPWLLAIPVGLAGGLAGALGGGGAPASP